MLECQSRLAAEAVFAQLQVIVLIHRCFSLFCRCSCLDLATSSRTFKRKPERVHKPEVCQNVLKSRADLDSLGLKMSVSCYKTCVSVFDT